MALTRTRITVDPEEISRFRSALSRVADPQVVERATVGELMQAAVDIAIRDLEGTNPDRAQIAALGGQVAK